MLNRAFREPGRRWLYDAGEIARVGTTIGLRQPTRCRARESTVLTWPAARARARPISSSSSKPHRREGERPLVSVLVPLRRTTYLERTIASVLDQTYDDFEVVIRDDGPADGAEVILRRFAHHPRFQRIRYIHNRRSAAASRTISSPASGRPPAHTSSTSVTTTCWRRAASR